MADERKTSDLGRQRTADERSAGDLGARLREARERRGMSLREIADATKISVRALDALERNDISRLPGGIFTRAFVRSYTVEVGLDPETVVGDFVRQFPDESVTAGHPPSARPYDGESDENERKIASTALKLAGISLPIAAIVLYLGMAGHRDPAARVPLPAVATSGSGGASAAPETGTAGAPVATAAATQRADRLSVEVVASRACQISAVIDGQPPLDVRLEAGERRVFDVERDLLLKVSDATAIAWSVNGVSGRSLGQAGAAAVVHLTPDNYRDYLTAR